MVGDDDEAPAAEPEFQPTSEPEFQPTSEPEFQPTVCEQIGAAIDAVTNAVGGVICDIIGETPPK